MPGAASGFGGGCRCGAMMTVAVVEPIHHARAHHIIYFYTSHNKMRARARTHTRLSAQSLSSKLYYQPHRRRFIPYSTFFPFFLLFLDDASVVAPPLPSQHIT